MNYPKMLDEIWLAATDYDSEHGHKPNTLYLPDADWLHLVAELFPDATSSELNTRAAIRKIYGMNVLTGDFKVTRE